MSDNLSIREYTREDSATVLELHKRGLEETESYVNDKRLDADLHDVEGTYLNDKGEFLIATIDNEIVGMGALRRVNEETAEVKRMRVSTKYQGKGIGSLILDRLIEKARQYGYRKLVLDTTAKQIAAQKLYQKRGFEEVTRKTIAGQNCIFYEMKLD